MLLDHSLALKNAQVMRAQPGSSQKGIDQQEKRGPPLNPNQQAIGGQADSPSPSIGPSGPSLAVSKSLACGETQ